MSREKEKKKKRWQEKRKCKVSILLTFITEIGMNGEVKEVKRRAMTIYRRRGNIF